MLTIENDNDVADESPARRYGCCGCISGLTLLILTIGTVGFLWLVRYYEQDALRHLSPREQIEFASWLDEPVKAQAVREYHPKPEALVHREKNLNTKLRAAKPILHQLPRLTPENQKERATSVVLVLEPIFREFSAITSIPGYTYNNRTPAGIDLPTISGEELMTCLEFYAINCLRLENQSSATESLTATAALLKHDPDTELNSETAFSFVRIWKDVATSTTEPDLLRKQLACITETSQTLADVHSEFGFLDFDDRHVGALMRKSQYNSPLPITRRDHFTAAIDKHVFFKWLITQPRLDDEIKNYIRRERLDSGSYYNYRIGSEFRRISVGPLKPLCRKLVLASDHFIWVFRYKSDRSDRGMEASLQKDYADLATRLTLKLAKTQAQE